MSVDAIKGKEKGLLIITLAALTMIGPMAIDMYLPALPAIAKSMNEPLSTIQLTIGSYSIGFALGQLIHGPLSDRFGRRKLIFPGLISFIISTCIAAYCTSAMELIIVRVLQALSAAAVIVIPPSIVRDIFPKNESAKVMSFILLAVSVSPLIAPFLGGEILVSMGWRAIFLCLSLLAVAIFILAVFRIPETLNKEYRLNFTVKQIGRNYLHVLRNRNAICCVLSYSFFIAGLFAFLTESPFVYIKLFGVKPNYYGLLLSANTIGLIIGNIINLQMINRFPLFNILRAGTFVATFSTIVLYFNAETGSGGVVGIVLPVIGYVSCLGLTGPNAISLALSYFPEMAGTASAVAGSMRAFTAALSSIITSYLHDGTLFPMTIVMLVCGVLSILSLFLINSPSERMGGEEISSPVALH